MCRTGRRWRRSAIRRGTCWGWCSSQGTSAGSVHERRCRGPLRRGSLDRLRMSGRTRTQTVAQVSDPGGEFAGAGACRESAGGSPSPPHPPKKRRRVRGHPGTPVWACGPFTCALCEYANGVRALQSRARSSPTVVTRLLVDLKMPASAGGVCEVSEGDHALPTPPHQKKRGKNWGHRNPRYGPAAPSRAPCAIAPMARAFAVRAPAVA